VARFAFLAAALSACALFPSVGDLGGSDADADADAATAPDVTNDVTVLPDAVDEIDAPAQTLYARTITIANGSNTLPKGYTIGVSFAESELQAAISAGKMRSDLADLRVSGSSGERDRLVDAPPLARVVWFSLAAPIAAGATDTSYEITYGDPNASSPPADGTKVFDFFDDFPGSSVDGSKWMTQGTVNVGGGFMTMPQGGLGAMTTLSLPPTSTVELRAKIADPTSDPDGNTGFYYWFGFQHTGDFVADDPWVVWIARDKGSVGAEQESDGCPSDCASATQSQTTSFRYYGIERQPAQTIFSVDGAESYTTTAAINDQALSLMIRNYLVTSDLVVDWIRAHARVYPEPAVTLGPEHVQ